MYRLSDSDSVDSDKGIRYKTDSIRNKSKCSEKDSSLNRRDSRYSSQKERKRSRSRSPRHHDYGKKRKIKKQRRRHSSEDEDRDKYSSRNKDKTSSRRPHETLGKHTRKSSREGEKKRSSKDSVEVLKKAKTATVSGPSLTSRISDSVKPSQSITNTNLKKDREQHRAVGTILPPHLKHEEVVSKTSKNIETDNASEQENIMGPTLPPHLLKIDSPQAHLSELSNCKSEQKLDDPNKSKEEAFGPSLPPELKEKVNSPSRSENRTVGPILPPELKQNVSEDVDQPTDKIIGPSLPPELKQKLAETATTEAVNEDEVYGPVPEGESFSKAHVELEERALKLKIDQLEPSKNEQPNREEWMLTLPKAKAANFGLGPRQFRAKEGPDLSDRSSWTDTPQDKARKKAGEVEPKVDLQKEAALKAVQRRDKEQEAMAKKHKRHKETLLEMHQKKLKEKKSDVGPSERRPFSREIDLQVNRFDEAQKKAVLKKAQLLDSRFSTGESKYL